MARSFKLTIAYDGTEFAGWQVQPGQPTIQQVIQRALSKVCKESVRVVGSGRTDAGVHALGQVASCTLPNWRASPTDLMRAVNCHLPPTVVVRDVAEVANGFHAIADAVGKRYRYQLQIGGNRDAFEYRYRWHLRRDVDVDAIRDAATRFVGRQDFASFQASGSDPKKTTTRDLRACDVIEQERLGEGILRFAIEVEADGFLYNMVRNIVGTLVEVGYGKRPPEWISEVIAACDRGAAGPTAPSHGLFLIRVDY